jgi:two-component system NarL family response regulator
VVLVHRGELFREGLAAILEREPTIELVSRFTSGIEAIEKVGQLQPDIILLNKGEWGYTWAEATRRISKLAPKAKIILLTYPWDYHDPLAMLKSGARAFISKDVEVENLIRAIAQVHSGELVIFPPVSDKIIEAFACQEEEPSPDKTNYDADLTEREKQVLAMMAQGKTNKEIGEALFISENTVKVHMSRILAKLHVRNRQQAVALTVGKAPYSEA